MWTWPPPRSWGCRVGTMGAGGGRSVPHASEQRSVLVARSGGTGSKRMASWRDGPAGSTATARQLPRRRRPRRTRCAWSCGSQARPWGGRTAPPPQAPRRRGRAAPVPATCTAAACSAPPRERSASAHVVGVGLRAAVHEGARMQARRAQRHGQDLHRQQPLPGIARLHVRQLHARPHPQGAALGLPREARRQPAGDRLAQVAGLRGCRRSTSAAAHLYCHHLDGAVGHLDFLRQVVHLRQHPGGAATLGHEGTAGISSDPSYGGQNRAVLRLPSPERLRSCCPS